MVEYVIICDTCGDLLDASHISIAAARKLAREAGRLMPSVKGDLCNQCSKERQSQGMWISDEKGKIRI